MSILCVESGGTFTDFCLIDDAGTVSFTKVPSDRADPSRALGRGIVELGVELARTARVAHGTTVGVNAILEQNGARLGLLTTRGFADVLRIQREYKDWNYDLAYQKPTPVVPRHLVCEVTERIDASGSVLSPLSAAEIARIVVWVAEAEVDALAVCLLHSYTNPSHERLILDALQVALPHIAVAISSDISPQIQEFERTSTTVLAAYISPIMTAYLARLEALLEGRGFLGEALVMQCSGGLATHRDVLRNPAPSILSGPAAGARGALRVAATEGIDSFVGMDIGGTSTDVFVVSEGRVNITDSGRVGRWPLSTPRLDVRSVGAGGGSLLRLLGNALTVGPQSAGAFPGPAAYGNGGRSATLTDALVVLGVLAGGRELGGEVIIDAVAASRSLRELDPALPPEEVAEAAIRVAVSDIAHQVRLLTLEQGLDPRDFWLVCYGGAGPMLGMWVAEELELAGVLIPAGAGVLSAYGLAACGYRKDYLASVLQPLTSGRAVDAVHAVVTEALKSPGMQPEVLADKFGAAARVSIHLGVRYRGQGHDLEIPVERGFVPSEVLSRFHQLHHRLFGYSALTDPVEIARCRVCVEVDFEPPAPLRLPEEIAELLDGPATIGLSDTTIVIPPGWHGELTEAGNLRCRRG